MDHNFKTLPYTEKMKVIYDIGKNFEGSFVLPIVFLNFFKIIFFFSFVICFNVFILDSFYPVLSSILSFSIIFIFHKEILKEKHIKNFSIEKFVFYMIGFYICFNSSVKTFNPFDLLNHQQSLILTSVLKGLSLGLLMRVYFDSCKIDGILNDFNKLNDRHYISKHFNEQFHSPKVLEQIFKISQTLDLGKNGKEHVEHNNKLLDLFIEKNLFTKEEILDLYQENHRMSKINKLSILIYQKYFLN